MQPDEELVELAKQDKAHFGALYERYATRIYSYVYYRTGHHHEAEDLTARVFVQALTHIDGYNYRGIPFSAWLFRIAHNLVANWHRDRSRKPAGGLEEAEHVAVKVDAIGAAEDRVEVLKAIAQLPPDRQSLIVLKYVDDLTNAEIAAVFGKSEGAVKALLHRTLRALRASLQAGRDSDEQERAAWAEMDRSGHRAHAGARSN